MSRQCEGERYAIRCCGRYWSATAGLAPLWQVLLGVGDSAPGWVDAVGKATLFSDWWEVRRKAERLGPCAEVVTLELHLKQ